MRFASAQSAPRYRRKKTSSCAATGFTSPLTVALSESWLAPSTKFDVATVAIDGAAGATTVFSSDALHGPLTGRLLSSPFSTLFRSYVPAPGGSNGAPESAAPVVDSPLYVS